LPIDPTGKAAMPVLIENLRDPKPAVRRFAAWTLADLRPVAADDVKPLTEAIQDPEPVVRVYAAGALWKIAQQDAVAVPVLVEALRSDDFHVRRWAAQNVLGTGPEAGQISSGWCSACCPKISRACQRT